MAKSSRFGVGASVLKPTIPKTRQCKHGTFAAPDRQLLNDQPGLWSPELGHRFLLKRYGVLERYHQQLDNISRAMSCIIPCSHDDENITCLDATAFKLKQLNEWLVSGSIQDYDVFSWEDTNTGLYIETPIHSACINSHSYMSHAFSCRFLCLYHLINHIH